MLQMPSFPSQDYQLSPPRCFEKTPAILKRKNCQYNAKE